MGEIKKLADSEDFVLLVGAINNGNTDLSPCRVPAVYGSGNFGDGAKETLKYINDLVEGDYKVQKPILGGCSLAGLFALWVRNG